VEVGRGAGDAEVVNADVRCVGEESESAVLVLVGKIEVDLELSGMLVSVLVLMLL
jgi:hypothetical protein